MQINYISTYYTNINNRHTSAPGFKAWRKDAVKNSGEIIYRTSTSFYRNDLKCPRLMEFLADKYKDIPKVNMYDYACSNGSEAFTIVMELLNRVKDCAKFFPIIGKDIDVDAVRYAQQGPIPITNWEKDEINIRTKDKFSDYFEKIYFDHEFDRYIVGGCEQAHYKPKDIFKEYVKFGVADILTDYKNIEPDNSVIFARNFWPYLGCNEQYKLAENLHSHLGKNSLIMIGEFDTRYEVDNNFTNMANTLIYCGFKKTDFRNVFEKNNG